MMIQSTILRLDVEDFVFIPYICIDPDKHYFQYTAFLKLKRHLKGVTNQFDLKICASFLDRDNIKTARCRVLFFFTQIGQGA